MVESAESFGKYTLLEKVAVGGMAEIYRAKTEGIGGFEKLLAIKRLHPQFGDGHDVAQMLVDEARIAVHLTHPNIAQVFDLGCIDDQYFIAMEYIDGVDLHQANKRSRERGSEIPVPALVFAMAEALGGLHYAHERTDSGGKPLQIVHRDVSPQNIMISYEGEVKIVDFGIAKAESRAQDDTQHGIIKGKFYYMSPEQAHGHRIDARTDVFAAGMVLYELLVGKNPYVRVDEYELLKAVRKADFPPVSSVRSDINPALEKIVSRATQRDANYRYADAREMQMELVDFLDRHCGPYRRMELGEFVRSVSGETRSDQHRSDDHRNGHEANNADSVVMSRDDFAASEASMIFEAGSALTAATGHLDTDHLDTDPLTTSDTKATPFPDEELTQLWTPGAPEPAKNSVDPDEFGTDGSGSVGAESGGAGSGGAGSGGAGSEPKRATKETRLALVERLTPEHLKRAHLLLGALGVLVIGLGGILAYLLMSGSQPAATPEDASGHAAISDSSMAEPDKLGAVQLAAAVDVRITSTPPGAEVHLDGAPQGHTPVVLEELSTKESYELMLSLRGLRMLERTIQPTQQTNELDFELPAAGAVLKVATYPPNAQIQVDGEAAGHSPVDIPDLQRSEPHEIIATLDDGRKLSRTISWDDDDGRVKQVELKFGQDDAAGAPKASKRRDSSTSADLARSGRDDQKLAAKGNLSVRIEGAGKVYVDHKLVADATSSYKHAFAAGTYDVRVYFSRLKRYSQTKQIRVRSGQTSTIAFAP
jgi:serine/threonine protein kinase